MAQLSWPGILLALGVGPIAEQRRTENAFMPRKPALLSTLVAAAVLLAFSTPQGALGQCKSGSVCSRSPPNTTSKTRREGRWYVAETANFWVCSVETEAAARRSAEQAESIRSQLASKWFGDTANQPWTPRCQIVLHNSRPRYIAAVGRGSEGTLGSSAVTFDGERVIGRRIDLLAVDAAFLTNALPHELTHVLLRDRFSSATLPRWADEGMAMLADPEEKQGRHLHDLRIAIINSTEFSASDLLTMHDYPRSDRRQAFYGQSAFLTKLLVAKKTPQHFVAFLERANAVGYDKALRDCYGLDGMARLDRQWRSELYAGTFAPSGKKVAQFQPVASVATAHLP